MNYLKFEVSDFLEDLCPKFGSVVFGVFVQAVMSLNSLRVCFTRFKSEELGRTESWS